MKSLLVLCLNFLIASSAHAITGSYTVPVDSPAATTELKNVSITSAANGATFLMYSLSEDLIGPSTKISSMMLKSKFTAGEQRLFKFEDPNSEGWALCEGKETGMSCTVDYELIDYDKMAVDSFLKNKFSLNKELLNEKLKVAAVLGSDPVGLLNLQCEVANCGL